MASSSSFQDMLYKIPAKPNPNKNLKALDEATTTENAMALICPCYVYGKAIGHLLNRNSLHPASCCTWGCVVCAGLASSSVAGSMVSAATGTQVAQVFYALFCMGYYLPHCICGLPLSLEMRAHNSGLNHPNGCETKAIIQTAFCPCLVLASVEKWAQKHKGKVMLAQDSTCIFPPMELIDVPPQLNMQT
jgi:hypothetical protein